jgi:hypothetical protein
MRRLPLLLSTLALSLASAACTGDDTNPPAPVVDAAADGTTDGSKGDGSSTDSSSGGGDSSSTDSSSGGGDSGDAAPE